MPIPTLDAEGRQLSIALLDEAAGPTVSPIPLLEPVMVVGTAPTIARVAALVAEAKPLESHTPDAPPPQRMFGTQFIVSPGAEGDRLDFHTFHAVNQAGLPRTDPILRLKNFSVAGTKNAKKAGAKKPGPTAEVNHRPPRHRPSPTRHQKAAILANGPAPGTFNEGPQGAATTSDVTPKADGTNVPKAAPVAVPPKRSAAKAPAAKAVKAAARPSKAGTQPATKKAAAEGTKPKGSKR